MLEPMNSIFIFISNSSTKPRWTWCTLEVDWGWSWVKVLLGESWLSWIMDDMTSASSLTVFQQKLKTFILAVISGHYCVVCLWLFSPWWSILAVIYFGHLKNCYATYWNVYGEAKLLKVDFEISVSQEQVSRASLPWWCWSK